MRVSGFTFVRNGVTFDYPFIESISSLLPLCDEVIVAVGDSEDDTLQRIQSLPSNKIRIVKTMWDDSLRKDGRILAQQTNLALQHVSGDWAIYLQADEVLHENDFGAIRRAMSDNLRDTFVEGLLFNYVHFYGSYQWVGASRRWYRREVRIIRPGIGVESWGDAQGFRIQERKLRVKLVDASIFHYGWVKPPEIQQLKQKNFNKYWHSDDWVRSNVGNAAEFDYSNGGRLKRFEGTHPNVMQSRVSDVHWQFNYNPNKLRRPFKEELLDRLEDLTGWRAGEYKNYVIV